MGTNLVVVLWSWWFIFVAIEFSERLSYFGIATNMITYMTKVMHQDLKTAADSVNIWTGVTTVTPLLGAFLADACTGRYFMILFSALLYVLVSPSINFSLIIILISYSANIIELIIFLNKSHVCTQSNIYGEIKVKLRK